DSGMLPLDSVRDPRIGRLWTKYKETDLPVPTFKIDECYVGRVPPKELTFARLNDNIREPFLTDMCKKYGDIEEVEILYNPKNKKHLGIAKVVFENVKAAKLAVESLHNTSVMGNLIHVELDPKGENRLRYFQLLLNGSYTPWTLPLGGEDGSAVSPRSLAEALLNCEPNRRLSESGTSGGTITASSAGTNSGGTPLSVDTAYSSLRQDTPQSQGTPHTPRQMGTPFSQDSNYSSRQSTPAYPAGRTDASFKSRRHEGKFQDAYNRRPERPQYRSTTYRGAAPLEQAPYKPHRATPPQPPAVASPFTATAGFKSSFPAYQAPPPPAFPPAESSQHQPGRREGEYIRPPQPPPAAPSAEEGPETPPAPQPPPEPGPPPGSPPPRSPERRPSPEVPPPDLLRNSLDSRIEMLLKEKRTKLPFLAERDSDTEVRMEGSPISSSSSQLSPIPPSQAGPHNSRPSSTGLEDVSPTPLPESDDEDPVPGSLLKRTCSPLSENVDDLKAGPFGNHTPTGNTDLGHHSSGEDMEISEDEMPGSSPPNSGDCAKGIVVNSAVSPMHQTISMAPHGFAPLAHQSFGIPHTHLSVPGTHPHLAGVPHHMLQHMGPYPPGLMPMIQMDLMNCLPQWGSVHMSFQMQTHMLSRMSQTGGGPYPYPHFMGGGASVAFGGPYTPVSMGATPGGSPGQPWPRPSIPKFNPAVPPPGYEDREEDPHKATVDGVLLVIVKELKAIMKRDLNRKMVEVVAFRAFDDWWDKKERSAKASLTPVKAGEGKEEERPKPKEPIGSSLLENWSKGEVLSYEGMGMGMGLRGAIRLPSFKVKRKPDPISSGDTKRPRPSTPVDDELEDEERDRDPAELPLEDSKLDADSAAAKRRHSRPLELDSEGEEQVETSEKEESLSDRDQDLDEAKATERLSSDKESAEEEEDEEAESSGSESDSTDSSDDEVESSASSKVSYDSSAASGDSSDYESSSGEEEEEEEKEEVEELVADVEDGDKEARVQSSSSSSSSSASSSSEDEEEKSTPSVPCPEEVFTDCSGSREDRRAGPKPRPPSPLEDLLPPGHPSLDHIKPLTSNQLTAEAPLTAKSSAPQEYVLRPPTPTGSLSESDNDTQAKSQTEAEEVLPTSGKRPSPSTLKTDPASLMHLPLPPHPTLEGRSPSLPPPVPVPDLPLPPHPTLEDRCSLLPPPGPHDLPQWPRSSTDEEDVPRTPGRELLARGLLKSQSGEVVPVTPGSDAPLTGSSLLLSSPHIPGSPFSYPARSPVLASGIPRTPGRDLTFTPVFPDSSALTLHRKPSLESPDQRPLFKEPPVAMPTAPRTASVEDSADLSKDHPSAEVPVISDSTPAKRKPGRPKIKKFPVDAWTAESLDSSSHEVPVHPTETHLREPVPDAMSTKFPEISDPRGLDLREDKVDRTAVSSEDGFPLYRLPGVVQPARRARRRWEELLLDGLSPVATPSRPCFALRSHFEEVTILYDIWNDGIDEEDIGLLRVTYDKMLQQDHCNDWLNDTLWRKRREDGMRDHMTGCARSEGYYKIDKKDKIKYLQSTRLLTDEPPSDTQGMSIPAQVQASTRSGSERRSEQRRLLSSFACDSDLLKFNQLKFRKKRIRFCRSGIHDWGLFALEPIAADEMVIEYVGQNIRQVIADMREKRYEDEGIGSSYMFRVDHDTIIDATKCGNFARFINHSCNPNCYAKVITVESQKKIVIYSGQRINVNEEITYDYKFPIEDEKIPCLCGAENCRGTLN
ncbi:hypothetical protein NHX12_027133, partial [Muraenolepis orangiensis]